MVAIRIDLNADLGEDCGNDLAMLEVVTSANVACGAHAGGPETMFATMAAAGARGVALGAHPGYADRPGFGRSIVPMTEGELERLVAYQVGAAAGIAALAGLRLSHVKAHGALYNLSVDDPSVARAIARGVRAVDPGLRLLVLAASPALAATEAEGIRPAAEIFADRAYLPDGRLMPRDRPGAVLHDAAAISARVLDMLDRGSILAGDGSRLPARMDSICLHGDTPGAVEIARALKQALVAAGVTVAPPLP